LRIGFGGCLGFGVYGGLGDIYLRVGDSYESYKVRAGVCRADGIWMQGRYCICHYTGYVGYRFQSMSN
jgi:hypothetical protein